MWNTCVVTGAVTLEDTLCLFTENLLVLAVHEVRVALGRKAPWHVHDSPCFGEVHCIRVQLRQLQARRAPGALHIHT